MPHETRLKIYSVSLLPIMLMLTFNIGLSTTVIKTGFEADESPPYTTGTLNGQNGWQISAGSADIVNDTNLIKSRRQGTQLSTNNQTLTINRTFYSGSEPGVSGIVYCDFWVKVVAMSGKYLTFNGYDLYGGSQKRTFVFEFGTPSNNAGEFRIYSGSTKVAVGQYTLGVWNRISLKVDYTRSLYQVIFNRGTPISANFREEYTPTASGTRQAVIKELHQLRINLGYDSAIGSVIAAMDDIYLGTDPIEDISFEPLLSKYSLTIEQPAVGSISVTPELNVYPESTWVTVSLTLPDGYLNLGWTGDLTGIELTKTFFITKDMTISAQIGIDPTYPPPKYYVTVVQPSYGAIVLSPPGGLYYQHTLVTANLELPTGYLFTGWSGDLVGTEPTKSFRVLNDMTISAVVVPDTTPPKIYRITNAIELKNVLKGTNLRPGDIVEVQAGSYDTGANITIESAGTEIHPIIIRSQRIGGAILTGKTAFTLRKAAYIQIEGFDFSSNVYTAIKLEACHHIRITHNLFHLNETDGQSGKWVYIGGWYNDPYASSYHNRIDHNLFENKHQLGNFITIDGQQEPVFQVSQYDQIDHNYFRNIGPRAVNEMEAIRVGVSNLSMSSGYTIIESNLFEDCDGDPEIVSIKACDVTVRYNTFRHSQGTLCLRHGNRNVVEGNFFLGDSKAGTGGIRLYGNDHKIFNNYFANLTGSEWDAALTLTNGDYDGETSGGLTQHWRIKRAFIGFNTLVNCFSNIEIGFTNNGSYNKAPSEVTFAYNLVVAKQNVIINLITQPINSSWTGNIMFPDSIATLGITATESEIRDVDPLLTYSDQLWLLTAHSPAVDAVNESYPWIIEDIQGQPRTGCLDIGADEFSTSPVIRLPLTPEYVGPWASEPQTSIKVSTAPLPINLRLYNYPNPFNIATTFEFVIPQSGYTLLSIYNLNGQLIQTILQMYLLAGKYTFNWPIGNLPSGTYLSRLQTATGQCTSLITLIK